ncbi:substrate-binding periplasmic protein [Pseudomonas sp. NPDC090202]|uniref:substrate-binding periplasmic protein n=1 Tax=unclassified Pseudomonas TaxID=196821 RepID=UPI0038012036
MKWIFRCIRGAFGALLAWSSMAAAAPAVDVYFAEAPPLTMLDQNGQHGITGDVIIKAMAMAGYTPRLVSSPWPRAQRDVASGESLLIAPLSRTNSRENNYTWIAPLMTMDRAFFSLDRRVDSFDEAKSAFKMIAVGLGSAQETRLREEGFADSQIYPLKIGDNAAQLLLKGRVDAWFNGVPESLYIWKQVSDRPLIMGRVLMTANLYLACSKDCDPQMVDKLRTALDTLESNGTIDRIEENYLRGLPVR